MNLDEAKTFLDGCDRHELRDHAFGDMEVSWTKDETEVACGYLGGANTNIDIHGLSEDVVFKGDEARALMGCGTLAHRERNDETGPDDFVEGRVMPGLSVDDVHEELVHRNVFEKEPDGRT